MELTKDELMTILAALSQYVIQLNRESTLGNRNDLRSAIVLKTKVREELRKKANRGLTE